MMTSENSTLSEIIKNTKFKVSDIEYILKYLEKEDISPQLAMRRIKTLDKVMERLDDNRDKEKIKHFENELEKIKAELTETTNQKSELEDKVEELESDNGLLKSETEQLSEQLNAMQEIHSEDLAKEEAKRKTMDENIDAVAVYLNSIIKENEKMKFMLEPIHSLMKLLKGDRPIEWDSEIYVNSFGEFIDDLEVKAVADYKRGGMRTSNVRYGIKKPQEPKKEEKVQEEKNVEEDEKDKIKEEIKVKVQPPKEVDKPITKKTTPQVKKKKPVKKEEKVDEATMKVLNLFEEFIEEADDDAEFQKRVRAICETDEAYVHLGSIALSQIYSFQSKKLDKKDQLLKLLKTWKKTGVPW